MSDPLVSIIMRSYNEAWALEGTLNGLKNQEYTNWELIVIDSGSSDGSVGLFEAFGPAHFVQIQSSEYNPSRVMNQGMRLAQSEYGIFLNADATPQDENWLRPLVEALRDPAVGAVFGRQVPRPDCRAVFANDYDRCFGPNRESASWEHFFSMVSSGVRKDAWAKRGFLESLQYAEDDEFSKWLIEQGYEVRYCPDSVAIHSHNYTAAQAYKRSFGDGKALAASWTGGRGDFNFGKTVCIGWVRDFLKDIRFCLREKRLPELLFAAQIRWAMRRGRLDGFREGWDHYERGERR